MARIVRFTVRGQVSANVEDPSSNGFTRASPQALPSGPIKQARVRNRVTNLIGNLELVAMMEFWGNPDSGETPDTAEIGSFSNATGALAPTSWVDVSTTADDNQVAFLGWDTRNSSGTSVSTAEVQTDWEIELYEGHRVVELAWRQFIAGSTSQIFYPITDWLPADDAEMVRAVLELASPVADFEVQMGYQITNNKASPGSATAFGSAFTTAGMNFPAGYVAPSVDGKLYIRFGYFVRVTSAGTGLGGVWSKVEMVRN